MMALDNQSSTQKRSLLMMPPKSETDLFGAHIRRQAALASASAGSCVRPMNWPHTFLRAAIDGMAGGFLHQWIN